MVTSVTEAPVFATPAVADFQVSLNWSAVAGATGYSLKRSTVSGGPYRVIAEYLASPGHIDNGLAGGTTYHYIVTPRNLAGPGKSSLQVSAVPLGMSPYHTWKQNYQISIQTEDTAQPDGDGIPILIKYATGMTPGVSSRTAPAKTKIEGGKLALEFQRLDPATVDYVVEASSNLADWTIIAALPSGASLWSGSATASETIEGNAGQRRVTIADTAPMGSTPRRFLRLRVVAP